MAFNRSGVRIPSPPQKPTAIGKHLPVAVSFLFTNQIHITTEAQRHGEIRVSNVGLWWVSSISSGVRYLALSLRPLCSGVSLDEDCSAPSLPVLLRVSVPLWWRIFTPAVKLTSLAERL